LAHWAHIDILRLVSEAARAIAGGQFPPDTGRRSQNEQSGGYSAAPDLLSAEAR